MTAGGASLTIGLVNITVNGEGTCTETRAD
jgi:hypothetical protein